MFKVYCLEVPILISVYFIIPYFKFYVSFFGDQRWQQKLSFCPKDSLGVATLHSNEVFHGIIYLTESLFIIYIILALLFHISQ